MFCNSLYSNYPLLPARQVTPGQYMQPTGTGMAMPTQYPVEEMQMPTQMPAQMPMQMQTQMPAQMPMQMPMQMPGSTIVPGVMSPVTIGGFEQGPPTLTDIGYTPAFLRTQIGKRMRIQFLIGTDSFLDKAGTLVGVGISYVLLKDDDTGDIVLADMYSIKFVNIFQ